MESISPDTAPSCVASTFDFYNCSTAESVKREAAKVGQTAPPEPRNEDPFERDGETNVFKSAQWSPDGTCILTNSSDNHLRTFVLYEEKTPPPCYPKLTYDQARPTDLLETDSPHELVPYSTLPSFEPIYSTALYPYFNLQDPSTTLFLSTPRDHPIRLTSALHPTPLLATYPLIHPPTERYLTPHSLLFTSSGTHFLTGTDSLIALFDMSRPGSGPIERHATIPSKRKKIVGGGVGMKGIVSCLTISREGVLAAGTFTRCVGLYDSRGSGDCIAVFSVSSSTTNSNSTNDNDNANANDDIGGTGITQVLWSPCGTYLYVAERQNDGILVYDIRIAGKKLGCLVGRKAFTNQRLGVDVVDTGWGNEIWAGGVDGVVRVWEHAGMMEGRVEVGRQWKAHNDAVSSTIVHPSGSVVATCSGQRHGLLGGVEDDSDESEDSDLATSSSSSSSSSADITLDNSLKIWRI